MAETSLIEWTDATWNPITGCTLVSDGCRHCYAATLAATRLRNHPSRKGLARINAAGEAKFTGEVRLNEEWLDQPLRWRRPRRIFVCAHGDLFHEAVPNEWIDRVFAVMALAPWHTFQVLTKRPERAKEYMDSRRADFGRASDILADMEHSLSEDDHQDAVDRLDLFDSMGKPLPNVWLGTSVEDQATADARIPHLLATPAAVRFASAEPLLGPLEIFDYLSGAYQVEENDWIARRLDWVIVGGESGRNARPMHPDWARDLCDQCAAAGTPFFFKQWGEWIPWEIGAVPMWSAQNGWTEDGNVLFPADMDAATDWDDGLDHYDLGKTDHAAFQRVGKKAAGRLLDGIEWNGMPSNDGRAEE